MEDIIIRGGWIIDGTGNARYKGDVAVRDGVITKIGDLKGLQAREYLDAENLIVSPGFIDAHAHSDTSFLRDDSCASKLYQGITLEVTGQCGDSPFPRQQGDGEWQTASFDAFVRKFENEGRKMAVHQAIMMGHGSLRAAVMGYEDRKPTDAEMGQMKALLDESLVQGAWGMSMGLEYAPGFFAQKEELSQLGEVVKKHDGVVTCHMRSEGRQIFDALEELICVGEASGVRVHASHLKIDHYSMHGQADKVWQVIECARKRGVRITADVYPFTASCTSLTIRCPKWSLDGGNEALLAHLSSARRQDVIEGIRTHYFNAERADTCFFCDDGGLWSQIVGRSLRDVAENDLHTTDYAWAAAEILVRTRARVNCIFFVMDEGDMRYFLKKGVSAGSDGWALSGDPGKVEGKPHPRSYAAVSEFLRIMRDEKLCTPEEAVRRITSAEADVLGMRDRGRLLEGMKADITVFDWDAVAPRSTYMEPVQLSAGVRHVLVDGCVALKDGAQTKIRSGKFLRKM